MLHSVILADSVSFFSRPFSQVARGSGYHTTGHRSVGHLSFRRQCAGMCLAMVVMREQRAQEDLRKQKWLSTPSETLSSDAQLDPQ